MRDFLNDLIHNAPKRTNPAHASLLLIIGIYICYLGVKMVKNTQTGESSMPMNQSIILCVIMCIAGGIVVIYGLLLFYHSSKHHYYGSGEASDTTEETETEVMDNSDSTEGSSECLQSTSEDPSDHDHKS